jgi:hypothetical protein
MRSQLDQVSQSINKAAEEITAMQQRFDKMDKILEDLAASFATASVVKESEPVEFEGEGQRKREPLRSRRWIGGPGTG